MKDDQQSGTWKGTQNHFVRSYNEKGAMDSSNYAERRLRCQRFLHTWRRRVFVEP